MAQVCQLTVQSAYQILENTRNPIDAIGNSFEAKYSKKKKKKKLKTSCRDEISNYRAIQSIFLREYGSGLIFEERGEERGEGAKKSWKRDDPRLFRESRLSNKLIDGQADRRARRENAEGKKCWQGVEGKNGLRDIVEIRI